VDTTRLLPSVKMHDAPSQHSSVLNVNAMDYEGGSDV
jgi:hypothetical protein